MKVKTISAWSPVGRKHRKAGQDRLTLMYILDISVSSADPSSRNWMDVTSEPVHLGLTLNTLCKRRINWTDVHSPDSFDEQPR